MSEELSDFMSKMSKERTEHRSLIIIILIGLVFLIGGAAYGYVWSAFGPPAQAGRIQITPASWDFGEIQPTAKVSHTFTVTNVGQGPLEITAVSTSCGCTTAQIGSRRLAPGAATDLKVTYDPQAHGGETGEFMRLVYVRSNDPDIPEANLTIRVTVVEP